MSIKERIDQDLKQAMLAGDKTLVTTLRGLKSALLYVEVAQGKRDTGLDDEEVIPILQKEAKKRQESSELYAKGGNTEKQAAEETEKSVIERYLPKQIDDAELQNIVKSVITATGANSVKDMGKIIGLVKQQTGAAADGSRIAALVRQELVR